MIAQTATQSLENMSVYIPHVFPNFTEQYIAGVFKNLRIGMVDHIDLVAKMDKHGKHYNTAYIYFKYWFSGAAAKNMHYRIKDKRKEARIVHDDPWFWILLENKVKKYKPAARKPCIDIAPKIDLKRQVEIFKNEATEFDVQNKLSLEVKNRLLQKQIAKLTDNLECAQLELAYFQDVSVSLNNVVRKISHAKTMDEVMLVMSDTWCAAH